MAAERSLAPRDAEAAITLARRIAHSFRLAIAFHCGKDTLAVLDVATGLATLAVERRYVRPEVDRSLDFIIEGGRHAVVEQALAEPFVANDCDLSPPAAAAPTGEAG